MQNTIENPSLAPASSSSEADVSSQAGRGTTTKTPLYLLKGLTKQNIDALYFLAHHFYEEENYDRACPFFQLMTFLDGTDKRGWLGAAACHEARKDYPRALRCYTCAGLLDLDDPMPLFRSFHCYLENNEKKEAVMALEGAIEIASKEEERYADLAKQATSIKEALLQ